MNCGKYSEYQIASYFIKVRKNTKIEGCGFKTGVNENQ
jgi:hypothetical protein